MPNSFPEFSKKLIAWYLRHKRDLPWRHETAPYFIWLSEIMLQQTRVDQGLPYYLKFVEAFPTVQDLANADEQLVLKLWQGLGYYSRARNLHAAAKTVVSDYDGEFPNTKEGLLELKGVGDYTASAIASICYHEAAAVVDGNVYRVLSRYFDIDTPINSTQGIKQFKLLAQELIDSEQPGTYNQALMEFGARHCVPQNPDCDGCIFSDGCRAYQLQKVKDLPVKLKKQKVKKRFFNYIVPLSENSRTKLVQRNQKGIWHKLYEFPLIETDKVVTKSELTSLVAYKNLQQEYKIDALMLFNDDPRIHKLSHQHLHTRFWIADIKNDPRTDVSIEQLNDYPVPVLIENFISEFEPFKN